YFILVPAPATPSLFHYTTLFRSRDPRVHARGRRPQPRAPDRGALPQGGDAGGAREGAADPAQRRPRPRVARAKALRERGPAADGDRKSTRLNSSHVKI